MLLKTKQFIQYYIFFLLYFSSLSILIAIAPLPLNKKLLQHSEERKTSIENFNLSSFAKKDTTEAVNVKELLNLKINSPFYSFQYLFTSKNQDVFQNLFIPAPNGKPNGSIPEKKLRTGFPASMLTNSVIIGQEKDKFINADYIKNIDGKTWFIATQSPLKKTKTKDTTIEDFWQMVWEQKSDTIIMLTKLQEKNSQEQIISKADRYWPPAKTKLNIGPYTIELTNTSEHAESITRTFQMTYNKKTRSIKQYHYRGWPDNTVPIDSTLFREFFDSVQQQILFSNSKQQTPVIVHCSAGVGRAGVFIALFHTLQILNEFKDNNDLIDTFKLDTSKEGGLYLNLIQTILQQMRVSRKLVYTEDQFKFICQFVYDYLQENLVNPSSSPMQIAWDQWVIENELLVTKINKHIYAVDPLFTPELLSQYFYIQQDNETLSLMTLIDKTLYDCCPCLHNSIKSVELETMQHMNSDEKLKDILYRKNSSPPKTIKTNHLISYITHYVSQTHDPASLTLLDKELRLFFKRTLENYQSPSISLEHKKQHCFFFFNSTENLQDDLCQVIEKERDSIIDILNLLQEGQSFLENKILNQKTLFSNYNYSV